jgi:hypothetical protein
VFIVELFMNTCGISFLEGIDQLEELNLKKFQQVHCQSDKKQAKVSPLSTDESQGPSDEQEPQEEDEQEVGTQEEEVGEEES